MQMSGTFPELNAGLSKGKKSKPAKPKITDKKDFPLDRPGIGGFGMKSQPRARANPPSFAGRQALAHSRPVKK